MYFVLLIAHDTNVHGHEHKDVNEKVRTYKLDPEELGGHFEGDMILNEEQLDFLNGFSDRNGLTNLMRRWTNNVLPYVVDTSKFGE